METLNVKVSRPYDICVGNEILDAFIAKVEELKLGNHAVLITNETLNKIYADKINELFSKSASMTFELIVLPDTEKIKSFEYLTQLCNKVAQIDFTKKYFFVGIGGGVIGDLTGFLASIIKRGKSFINVPTSLLAQIDSSIGGKTAIDLEHGKNLVGTFWQPSLVYSDVNFFKTLPKEQIIEGLAEAIKYALIADKDLFDLIYNNTDKIFDADTAIMQQIVTICSDIKRKIVQEDERETKGLRVVLNFGHTFAHGLETVSDYELSHGNAVSIGIVAALYLSQALGLLKDETILTKTLELLNTANMPIMSDSYDLNSVMTAMRRDKKFVSGKNRFVLLSDFESPEVVEDISWDDIEAALAKVVKK